MKKYSILMIFILSAGLPALAQDDGDNAGSAYKKSKIKNRARLQAKRGTDSIGNKQYIYADDSAVDEALEEQDGLGEFSIGSITLKKGSKIKEVNILVEGRGKKKINLDTKGKEPAVVNIGHVTEEKGSRVKRVRSIIEMEIDIDN